MITTVISKALNLKELEQLDKVKRKLFTVVRKHKRKLIRTKLYLHWETKYATKTVRKWVLRTVTGRLWGAKTQVSELTITLNRLSGLVSVLEKAGREYLELVRLF